MYESLPFENPLEDQPQGVRAIALAIRSSRDTAVAEIVRELHATGHESAADLVTSTYAEQQLAKRRRNA